MNKTIIHRLSEVGPAYASLDELLTAVTGDWQLAHHILTAYPSAVDLAAAHETDLMTINGVGPAMAARIRAAFELGRRMQLSYPDERTVVRSPSDAAALMMSEMSLLEQEELRVMVLGSRNNIIGVYTIYKGSVNSISIRSAEVFREALRRNAPAIIVFHNHPSGDPSPSPEDVSVTHNMVAAGTILDIELLDHIVIGRQRFVSLKERGLGFN